MTIQETTKTALISLRSNKLRSFLTMLGVIIGVFAVVSLVSLGKGIQNYITDQFNELGANLLYVMPGNVGIGGDPARSFTRNKLDDTHVQLIETNMQDDIEVVLPFIQIGDTIHYRTKTYFAEIIGFNERGFSVLNYTINLGRTFNETEVRAKKRVAVIGPLISKELFGSKNPVGERIEVGEDTYEVIGTFKTRGSNYDDMVLIPNTTGLDSFGIKNYATIVVKIKEGRNMNLMKLKLESAMLRDLDSDEFSVMSQEEILNSVQDILRILTLALSAIASISLLVGGIGIMNIMLVSVTERIREIGLRKALGATPNRIALQFLIEATLISVAGGLIGLILGGLLTLGVQSFVRAEITLGALLLAITFSTGVGLIFGTYPAIQASKKDPITALRYE